MYNQKQEDQFRGKDQRWLIQIKLCQQVWI